MSKPTFHRPGPVLITGGSNGIGRATAIRLAELGAEVVVGYHSRRDAAEALVADLPGQGHMTVQIGVDDNSSILAARDAVAARHGRLDALVGSGGSTQPVPLGDLDGLSDEIFDRTVGINLRGPFAVIRAFRPLLERGEQAAVVNVSSLAGKTGAGSSLAYAAAKGGLDTLTRGLAKVLAPVRVFSVSPAGVDTDFVPGRPREALETTAAQMPLRKVTTPDDVARAIEVAITHLTSSTGIDILVDEGRHL